MGELGTGEKKLLARIVRKRAVILHDGTENDMYVALANGDRRCRPIAWVDRNMLTRLLACEALMKRGAGYEVVPHLRMDLKLKSLT